MIELRIYAPKPDTWPARTIRKGSGIVGQPTKLSAHDVPRIKIDYQDVHGLNSNIQTWEDAVFHAAGRQLHTGPGGPPALGVSGYPTGSRMWAAETDLVEVGVFYCQDDWKYTIEITDQEALDAWRNS